MKINILLESKKESDFESHMMYDPNSEDKEMAKTEEDHERLERKGYIHIDPKELRDIIGKQQGGAAGLDPFTVKFGKDKEQEIKDALKVMDDIGQHHHGDYIMQDDETEITKDKILVQIISEEIKFVLEKRKKRKKKKKKSSGKKDACYSKVKSRYKVWPSAYASGALVKCRKVGAKNWGNKSKKK
jgi:hypothetical protein